MSMFTKAGTAFNFCRFLLRARRPGAFSHSPFTKSGMLYVLSSASYAYAPGKIIQLGVGEGVSCIAMLLMAKLRGVKNPSLTGYDNFAFRSVGATVSKSIFWKNLKRYGVNSNVTLHEENVTETKCPYSGVDLLNIDIDNTYEKLIRLYELGWFDCVSDSGLIVIEGGASKHDNLEGSRRINEFCLFLQKNNFQTFTFRKHPGMVFVRKISVSDNEY